MLFIKPFKIFSIATKLHSLDEIIFNPRMIYMTNK